MKIAVSSTGPNLDSAVEARFGRCPYFLIVDPATLEFEAIANANLELRGGAGIQAAQLVSEKEPSVVLTGSCGPNASQVFNEAGIKVVTGVAGSVLQVVQQFTAGSLKTAPTKQTTSRFPERTGQGMGRGMGGGGGRGMGGGGRYS